LTSTIGEFYPQAYAHLRTALDLRSAVITTWRDFVDGGGLSEDVVLEADGAGRLRLEAMWPDGLRDELTGHFTELLDALWATLDSLVTESVAMFSIRRRPSDPDRPRFFPMANSEEGLVELLRESCLNGVLTTQYRVVVDAQPFWGEHDHPRIQTVRTGLAQMVDWQTRLADGAMLSAWVTPVEPAVHVDPPLEVRSLEASPPGELTDAYVVAGFRLADYEPGADVSGQMGSYVDLAFADGGT